MNKIILTAVLLFGFSALAVGKIQDADVKSVAELVSAGAGAPQLINDTKIYVTASGINAQLSTAIASGLLGGGSGGALQWIESALAPFPSLDAANNRIYSYTSGDTQHLYTVIKVPSSYAAGRPIKLFLPIYSGGSSGTILIQSTATLIRSGTDAITSVANQRTSTNTAITTSGATVNKPQIVTLDLSSTIGEINSIAISPNDLVLVDLFRGTDTSVNDLVSMVYGAEPSFK